MDPSLNVLGGPLKSCSTSPITGWFRDGCCNTDSSDRGMHTVCCRLTMEFLEQLQLQGNDLITAHPEFNFPGLKDGDQWCVCAVSWRQAYRIGKACPVVLESTHAKTLQVIPLEELMAHSWAPEA